MMKMMRLAFAAALLPAAAAVHGDPSCTEADCCVPKVMGMCKDNTHDSEGRFFGDTGYDATSVEDVDCSSGDGTTAGNTQVKADTTGRTIQECCEAPPPPPPPAPTWSCADKSGDGATNDDPVTDADCGAGWEATDGATDALTAAFDVNLEAHKQACCTLCPAGEFGTAAAACDAHSLLICPAGKQPKFADGDSADCTDEDGCCEDCPDGTFSDAEGDAPCDEHSTCSAWEFINAAGTATADTDCDPHTITSCSTAGKEAKDAVLYGTLEEDCTDEAGCCEDCADGTFAGENNDAPCAEHSTCEAWEFINAAGTATADTDCQPHTITSCSTAGKGPKDAVVDGTLEEDCTDEAGCCEDCAAGTFAGANNDAPCAAHSTCDADTYISTPGSATADVTCSNCGVGKTSPAANSLTECTDITGYCMGNADGDDEDTALDKFECPDSKYVASNVMTAITTPQTAEACTAVPATGAAITDTATTCTVVDATCAPTSPATGCSTGFTGSQTSCVALTDSAGVTCVWTTGSCTVAPGAGGSCTYVAEIDQVGTIDETTCPGPAHAEDKTSGAATAASLAVGAALVAALA